MANCFYQKAIEKGPLTFFCQSLAHQTSQLTIFGLFCGENGGLEPVKYFAIESQEDLDKAAENHPWIF